MTVMMMLTKVRTTKFSIFSPLRSDKIFKLQKIGQKIRENEGDDFFYFFSLVFQVENGFLDKTMEF